MPNGHFGLAGPYARDPGAELQRWHRERREREERQERVENWLSCRLAGLTFHSYDSLVFAATRHWEIVRGAELTAEESQLIQNAACAVWAGLAQRARTALEVNERGMVESITFKAA